MSTLSRPGRLLLLSHGAKLDEATDEGCAVNGRLAKPAMGLNRFWIPTTGGVYRDTDLDDGVRQCRVSFRWLLGGVDIEYLSTGWETWSNSMAVVGRGSKG